MSLLGSLLLQRFTSMLRLFFGAAIHRTPPRKPCPSPPAAGSGRQAGLWTAGDSPEGKRNSLPPTSIDRPRANAAPAPPRLPRPTPQRALRPARRRPAAELQPLPAALEENADRRHRVQHHDRHAGRNGRRRAGARGCPRHSGKASASNASQRNDDGDLDYDSQHPLRLPACQSGGAVEDSESRHASRRASRPIAPLACAAHGGAPGRASLVANQRSPCPHAGGGRGDRADRACAERAGENSRGLALKWRSGGTASPSPPSGAEQGAGGCGSAWFTADGLGGEGWDGARCA